MCRADFSFPYFLLRKAPVTGIASYTRYDVTFKATKGDVFDLVTTVVVPVRPSALPELHVVLTTRGVASGRNLLMKRTRLDEN
ncbi:hypothetical protein MASR2M17_15720 [Aminivibrio sp.]